MSKLTDIKQKIRQLEGGKFQQLCDAYLYKLGYENIFSLGMQPGTSKTTKGTPDTYFTDIDGKYVFVMYTAQTTGDMSKKIQKDIEDCFNSKKTGVCATSIKKIIYCHTSSNLTAGQDNSLREYCCQRNVSFEPYGIDKIASDLRYKYPVIAMDELSVSVDTEQFFSVQDFVKSYDRNTLAAPLDTEFLFRKTELDNILSSLSAANIIVASGQPGVGKTRIGLEAARMYMETENARGYCIRSNSFPVYEDTQTYLDEPGKYILLIDDANNIIGLEHIIKHSLKDDYDVKIIITVREYAKAKVVRAINNIAHFNFVAIKNFSDNEIEEIVKVNIGELNQTCLRKIVRIADGNARLAVLAGKVAMETNRLNSIDDASQLYDNYYGRYLDENSILKSDRNVLISAGIVAFLGAVHLEKLSALTPIFEYVRLSISEFELSLQRLHELEIVDVIPPAVVFSEQCLSNYLVKYVFVEQKAIPLELMIMYCFPYYRERVIDATNMLINVFNSQQTRDLFENAVKSVWRSLRENNNTYFPEFVRYFYPVNPTEALILMKSRIEAEEPVVFDIDTIDFEKNSNNNYVKNDTIEILSGFVDTSDLESAIDLLFNYLGKCPNLFMEIYFAITNNFGVSTTSRQYGYSTQIKLVEKFHKYSDNWTNHIISMMLVRVARKLLKPVQESTENGRRGYSLILHTIPVTDATGANEYRSQMWGHLTELSKNPRYRSEIDYVLTKYGSYIKLDMLDNKVVENDFTCICALISETYEPSSFSDCLVVQELRRTFTRLKQDVGVLVDFKSNPSLILYNLLSGERHEYDYKRRDERKLAAIARYTASCDLIKMKEIVDLCVQLETMNERNIYLLEDGIQKAFKSINSNSTLYIETVRYYLCKNAPLGIYPNLIVSRLFEIIPENDVYALLTNYDYPTKNVWMYAYFYCLPVAQVCEKHVALLYDFLTIDEGDITRVQLRPLDFMDKYERLDSDAFVKCCRLIASKIISSPFKATLYFCLPFESEKSEIKSFVAKFHGHYNLLSQIYIQTIDVEHNTDRNGCLLSEAYDVYPPILDDYLRYMLSKDGYAGSKDGERLTRFWYKSDYMSIMDKIVESICCSNEPRHRLEQAKHVRALLKGNKTDAEKTICQDEWISRHIGAYSNDKARIYAVFSAIGILPPERRKQHIVNFTRINKDISAFKNISLDDGSWGSIEEIHVKISFLKGLLPCFEGVDYLLHRKLINDEIEMWRRHIENEHIEAMLRG